MDVAQRVFERPDVVAHYARSCELQPPEAALFECLKPELAGMDVLDLGVGAGLTALHFAPASRSYLGVDYSPEMIEECRRRLPGVRFLVGDVRSMDFAADASFDLVLFSYNGVDHLTGPQRAQFFLDVRRTLRPRGMLILSSHNTNFIPAIIDQHRFRLAGTLRDSLRSLKWAAIFQLSNPGIAFRLQMQKGRLVDGMHGFKAGRIYYIRPDRQIAVLRQLGMEQISCAPNIGGDFLPAGDPRIRDLTSPWVYYVCRKPRAAEAVA
jgi:SAM-dependent methyltransferase